MPSILTKSKGKSATINRGSDYYRYPMEKCGLKFHHYAEYSKTDGSHTFKATSDKIDIIWNI